MNGRTSTYVTLTLLIALLTLTAGVRAQAPKAPDASATNVAAAENPAHEALRAVRDGMIKGVKAGDVDAVVSYLHKNAVVVWMNGESTRGHDAVRAYYNRMMTGDDRIVQTFEVSVEAKELSFLYGDDTAIAYGTAKSRFVLTDGRDLVIDGPWSATLVKDQGKWSIGSFHASANMFDNPVLDKVEGLISTVFVVAALAGLILGLIVMAVIKRRKSA